MICTTTIPSTSNTLKNLVVSKGFHSSYIRIGFNDEKDMIINIFGAYVEPLLKDINYPEFLQEWKLNIDAAEYIRNIDANLYKYSKKETNLHDSDLYWPTSIKGTIQWFLFSPLWNILQIF